jgi:hypothetical protein
MITKVFNKDIFDTPYNHIAFAINTEGLNKYDFARQISFKDYTDLFLNTGEKEMGDVISIKVREKTFHGLVCHSLKQHGWVNAPQAITSCLEKIETDEPIAVVLMGASKFRQAVEGVDIVANIKAIHKAKKNVILYNYDYSENAIFDVINK